MPVKNVIFRTDASPRIGTGHVMRCAALGERLVRGGASVTFVSSSLPKGLADWLGRSSFKITEIATPDDWRDDVQATCEAIRSKGTADLLVVDHYQIDSRWEQQMRPYTRRTLVIDDLANRSHVCDLLLDQNLHDDAKQRYAALLPVHAKTFLGPRYALLRSEFDPYDIAMIREGRVNNLLVFFGGTDPGNQTLKVIEALALKGEPQFNTVIVLGPAHPEPAPILTKAKELSRVQVLRSTESMATLMAKADLAIGTCGIAAWERCVLALPSIVAITADNQREDATILDRMGAAILLGDAEQLTALDWSKAIQSAIENPALIRSMSVAASEITKGRHEAIREFEAALFL